jgi:hypothetical protein
MPEKKFSFVMPIFKSIFIITGIIIFTSVVYSQQDNAGNKPVSLDKNTDISTPENIENKEKDDYSLEDLPEDIYNYLKERPDEMLKYLKNREYYKQKDKTLKKDIITTQNEPDIRAITENASDDLRNIIV